MQVWQTPVRHDHLTGTSHASASSCKLPNLRSHATVIPLRANETEGPAPRGPSGMRGVNNPAHTGCNTFKSAKDFGVHIFCGHTPVSEPLAHIL